MHGAWGELRTGLVFVPHETHSFVLLLDVEFMEDISFIHYVAETLMISVLCIILWLALGDGNRRI